MNCMANGVPLVSDATAQTKTIFKNEAVIAVLSASIVSPFIVPKVNSLMDTVPILRDHKSLASFVAGLAMFSIAMTFGKPMIRAVALGVAGSFILSSILPLYSSLTTRNGGQ